LRHERRLLPAMPRILLVDDEPDLLQLLRYRLEREGFEVFWAEDGQEALQKLREIRPDLVVLDVMMPRMDGVETCKRIRNDAVFAQVPILMLTARTTENDEILGLEAGADDYLPKPISTHLFISRLRALLRRTLPETAPELEVASMFDIRVDRERYLVLRTLNNGTEEEIRLPRKEFELLYFLITHPGKVYSRQEILNQVWGSEVLVVDRTVDVHVRKIREKLGEDYIETVKGVGYRFKL